MIEPGSPLIFNIWLYMMLISAGWGVATVVLIGLLRFYFSKYDEALLRSPYFNSAEQQNYLHFPLSFHKTVIYIHLFSFKRVVRKRFSFPPNVNPNKATILLSYAAASAIYLQIALGASTLALMFALYFI